MQTQLGCVCIIFIFVKMVRTVDLNFEYSGGLSFTFPNIALPPKQHLLILGPSGVGKTTLLHLLSGILPVSSGTIFIDDIEITSLGRKALDRFRGAHIGLVFQQYHYVKSLTVEENLKLRQYFPKHLEEKKRRMAIAERLGLAEHLRKNVTALSQGQQQRLSIALGLIHRPKVVFADEPTSNLDDVNCEKVLGLLKEEANLCGSSLVIITHDHRVKQHFSNQIGL